VRREPESPWRLLKRLLYDSGRAIKKECEPFPVQASLGTHARVAFEPVWGGNPVWNLLPCRPSQRRRDDGSWSQARILRPGADVPTGKEPLPKGEAPQWTPLGEGNFSLKDFMERRRPE
jgi:hypothetical protein